MMTTRFLGFGLICALAGCGSSDNNRTLTALSPATTCAGGGVTIVTGVDDDGDGILDEGEIDSSQTVCSTQTVERVDILPPGADCPNGGTAVRVGIDDNNNGTLQDEEVDSSAISCNALQPVQVPGGAPGTTDILFHGGNGTGVGAGRNGGSVTIQVGPTGAWVQLFKTGGAADVGADFTVPTRTPVLGTAQFDVSGVVNVPHLANDTTGLVTGDHYTYAVAGTTVFMRRFMGGAALDAVQNPLITGINVAAAGELVFNFPATATNGLVLSDDVVNAGTIRSAVSPGYVVIVCRAYLGAAGSQVTTASTTVDGGTLTIQGNELIVNEGTITADGATLSVGTAGGAIFLHAPAGAVYNLGTVRSRGGEGTGTTGGNAGGVILRAGGGLVANQGSIDSSGGPGRTVAGAAVTIRLQANPGGVRNTGTLTANGGSTVSCSTGCKGGVGAIIDLTSAGGSVRTTGTVSATGGASGGDGCGGNGGRLSITAGQGAFQLADQGVVRVSGAITVVGGNGGTGANTGGGCTLNLGGGVGGRVSVTSDPFAPLAQDVSFYGYRKLDGRGGEGAAGGSGGAYTIERYNESSLRRLAAAPEIDPSAVIGGIANYVDADLTGGIATGTNTELGGSSGRVSFSFTLGSDGYAVSGLYANRVINAGALTVKGQTGPNGGGFRQVLLHGPEGVENSGAIEVGGGVAGGTVDLSGIGGSDLQGGNYAVALSSDYGPVSNTGQIRAVGGNGTKAGGSGWHICLEGDQVTNTAALFTHGGNTTTATGPNGNGGNIRLTSYLGGTTNSGTTTVAAGTGGVGGVPGTVYLDGQFRCHTSFGGYY